MRVLAQPRESETPELGFQRVGLAIPSAALRAALRLRLEMIPQVELTFCLGRIESLPPTRADAIVAELPMPTSSLGELVRQLVVADRTGRLVIVSFYAEAWATTLNCPRVQVLDLSTLDADALRATVLGTELARGRHALALDTRDELILELVARGHKNTDIAATLGLSSRTVQFRVSRLMSAAGVSSRAALMANRPIAAEPARAKPWRLEPREL